MLTFRIQPSTCDVPPGSRRPGPAQCGAAGPLGLRSPKRSRRCRAARPTAAALLSPPARSPSANGNCQGSWASGPRGRGLGSPWESELRLELRTIAPPPASQSEAEDTGAGRSELGCRVTTGARWIPERHPGPRLDPVAGRMPALHTPGGLGATLRRSSLERARQG